MGKYMCQKCHAPIEGEPLRFRGEYYCPYHFNCTGCGQELTSSAREVKTRPGYTAQELNELYCCLLYTSPSPRDGLLSRMPSSA